MQQPLAPDSLAAVALDAIVVELGRIESESRRIEAERIRLMSEALELAAVEGERTRPLTAGQPETHCPDNTRGELALRAIRAEIASALHLSERTVDRQLSQAYSLTSAFPAVLAAAMSAGDISPRHAAAIVDAGSVIGAGRDADSLVDRGSYAEAALSAATDRTPASLSAQAKRIAEQYAEEPLEKRHVAARRRRRVWVEDREDGMADLFAHLPATEAYAIKNRLARAARAVADREPAAGRTALAPSAAAPSAAAPSAAAARCRDEIQADVFADLLLAGDSGSAGAAGTGPGGGAEFAGIRASVQLVIPVSAISPVTGEASSTAPECPELMGYGPIDTASAHRLMGDAPAWDLVRTDPRTGALLGVDRYRPSEQMRRHLRARDRHCRFPGCRVPADRCDIDHTVDAALGGETTTSNLAHLCRKHHTLKHQTGWRVEQGAHGELEWTSPTGRRHATGPERPPGGRVRFTSAADAPY